MIKIIHAISALSLLLALCSTTQAGWPNWKFWQKSSNDCVDVCIDDNCSPTCCDIPCCDEIGCCDELKPILFSGRLFDRPVHWLSRVCGNECCEVDLCCSDDDCCIGGSCCETECCADAMIDVNHNDRCKLLAKLIYRSQTACSMFDRSRAIHRIGTDFCCKNYPEVMCALMYAMHDCEAYVRVEAADEIGDQLRKSHCCCSCQLISVLKCALNDENWRVRREAAQALRLCGYSVPYRFGKYCVEGRLDGCTDGCCIEGCCDYCIDESCLQSCPISQENKYHKTTEIKINKEDAHVTPQVTTPPMPEKVEVKKEDNKPAPPSAEREKMKKGNYVPDEDSTSFIMPSIRQTVGMLY